MEILAGGQISDHLDKEMDDVDGSKPPIYLMGSGNKVKTKE